MHKITVIHGSPHKGETYKAMQTFEKEVKKRMKAEFKNIYLSQENLEFCRGCLVCIQYGEEKCPVKDNVRKIYKTMLASDSVIFSTPVYSLQVSALLKNLMDRLAYVFHRPIFFRKNFMAVTTQGVYGDKDVQKYMRNAAYYWGFKTMPGLSLTTPPGGRTKAQIGAIDKKITQSAEAFAARIKNKKMPAPKTFDLMRFRFTRSMMDSYFKRVMPKDFEYYTKNGWLESDYYYDINLNPLKKIIGFWFDSMGKKLSRKMEKDFLKEGSINSTD